MNIFITLDYEIFFGSRTGSVDRCLIKPTQALMEVSKKHNIQYTFFVDIGFIRRLKHFSSKHPVLKEDYKKIIQQLKELVNSGHDLQLHIHPHWEKSVYDGKGWVIDYSKYRLHQYSDESIVSIVTSYKHDLETISGKPVFAFRAGGWCIQPFSEIRLALKENKVWLDSTVFKGGFEHTPTHNFDFRKTPDKTMWKFSNDPLIPDDRGFFTEVPISSARVWPFFYWQLAFYKVVGKVFKSGSEKMSQYGDGVAISSSKVNLLKHLTLPSYCPISTDGYKVVLINRIIKQYRKKFGPKANYVIIGHPKALTPYSLDKLEDFISSYKAKDKFLTFNNKFYG